MLSRLPTEYSTQVERTAIHRSGIVAQARVVASSYDEGGGDPGGWTTMRVEFVSKTGERIEQTTGHHYRNTEPAGATVLVRYDPAKPHSIVLVAYPPYEDMWDVAIGLAIVLAFGGTALALVADMLRSRRRSTVGD